MIRRLILLVAVLAAVLLFGVRWAEAGLVTAP